LSFPRVPSSGLYTHGPRRRAAPGRRSSSPISTRQPSLPSIKQEGEVAGAGSGVRDIIVSWTNLWWVHEARGWSCIRVVLSVPSQFDLPLKVRHTAVVPCHWRVPEIAGRVIGR
jgi:hypothetical protein